MQIVKKSSSEPELNVISFEIIYSGIHLSECIIHFNSETFFETLTSKGLSFIGIKGFGKTFVKGINRVPFPPAIITTGIDKEVDKKTSIYRCNILNTKKLDKILAFS